MENIKTCYGTLLGATVLDRHANGVPSLITLDRPNLISTPYGSLMPQYCPWEDGRRFESVISLYDNGNIKFMTMQHRTPLMTPSGAINAEGAFFYEDGTLKRVFPLYGKISGYWSETNEYGLAEPIGVALPDGTAVVAKFLGLAFYPSGALKSLTLWPKEKIDIETPVGAMTVRSGVSFYENGAMRSCEPEHPVAIKTDIGSIYAYDPLPVGINGDVNSLLFAESGAVTSLATVSHRIEVGFAWGEKRVFEPESHPSLCSDLVKELTPLRICFNANYVMICNREIYTFNLENHRFRVLDMAGGPAHSDRMAWRSPMEECCS